MRSGGFHSLEIILVGYFTQLLFSNNNIEFCDEAKIRNREEDTVPLLFALIFLHKKLDSGFVDQANSVAPTWRPLTNTMPQPIGIHAKSGTSVLQPKNVDLLQPSRLSLKCNWRGSRFKRWRFLSEPPHHCAAFREQVHDCSTLNLHISWSFNSTGQTRTNLGGADKKSVEAASKIKAGSVLMVIWKGVGTSQGRKKISLN